MSFKYSIQKVCTDTGTSAQKEGRCEEEGETERGFGCFPGESPICGGTGPQRTDFLRPVPTKAGSDATQRTCEKVWQSIYTGCRNSKREFE